MELLMIACNEADQLIGVGYTPSGSTSSSERRHLKLWYTIADVEHRKDCK